MAGRVMELAIAIRGRLEGSVGASMRAAAQEAARLRSQISNVNREMREAQRAAEAERRATGHVSEATLQHLAALQARLNQMTERRTQILEAQANVERRSAAFDNAKSKLANAAMTTAVLAAPIVAATKAAMDFESAMADVRKVVDFDSPQGFQQMSKDILELSQRLPMAAEDIAKIVAAGGQSGIAAGDLMQFAEAATKMGIAFDITADQAGDMMAKWRTAFKLNQDQVVDLADKINYLGNTTAASAPLISDVVTRIGPLGEIGGVASGEIAALGASMVGTGVQSDVAATGIKNLILGMTAGEGATKSQSEAFQKLGFDAAQMAQRMQTDAKGAILDLFKALQSLPKDQQATVLADLFGKESIGAIAPLLSNLDNLADNFNKVADASQYAGSMEAEYAARSQTTENQLQLAKNSLMAVAISIGSAILPAVNQLLSTLAPIASGFAAWASENKTIVQVLVAVAAAIAGVVLAALSVYTVVTAFQYVNAMIGLLTLTTEAGTSAGFLWTAMMKAQAAAARIAAAAQAAFNAVMAANPIALAVLAIAALIAAIVYLYNTNETVRNAVLSAWESIKSAAVEVWNSIAPIIASAWESIKEAAQEGIAYLQGIWQTIEPYVSAFGSFLVPVLSGLVSIIGTLFAAAVRLFGANLKTIITVVIGVVSAIATYLGGIVSIVSTVFSTAVSIASAIWNGLGAVVSGVMSLIDAILSGASAAQAAVFSVISDAADSAWSGIVSVVQAAVGIIQSVVTALTPVFQVVWTVISYAAKAAFLVVSLIAFGAIQNIMNTFRALAAIASAVWSAITAAASVAARVFSAVWSAAVSFALTVWGYFSAGVQVVMGAVMSIVQTAVGVINSIIQTIQSVAAAVWNSIVMAAQYAWSMLLPVIMPVVNFIVTGFYFIQNTAIIVWDMIRTGAEIAWNLITAVVTTVIGAIMAGLDALSAFAAAVWGAISDTAAAAWSAISAFVSSVLDTIAYYVQYVESIATEAWYAILDAANSAWNAIVGTVQNVIDQVMNIIDEGVANVEEKWNHLKEVFSHPIDAVVNFVKGGDSEAAAQSAEHLAVGGIYEKGAFLTTFAEESAEAAIPLDGSRRAISLWTQAGARLGMLPKNAPMRPEPSVVNNVNNVESVLPPVQMIPQTVNVQNGLTKLPEISPVVRNIVQQAPPVQAVPQVEQYIYQQPDGAAPVAAPAPSSNTSVTLEYNPTIHMDGNTDANVVSMVKQLLEAQARDFERRLPRMMEEARANKRRLSYG